MILRGSPLVPGRVRGRLVTGMHGNLAGCILLLGQQEIPSLLLQQPGNMPAGLIVRDAARFGHVLIRLWSLAIPTVLLDRKQASPLLHGQQVEIDGGLGLVADEHLPEPQARLDHDTQWRTANDEPIELMASIGDARGAALAVRHGATAIGLVRSEYLPPLPPRVPDQAFYHKAFGVVCKAADPLPMTVRLFDYGPDKPAPWWPEAPIAPLGLQGSRLYGLGPMSDALDAELAALAELSADRKLALLVPYLTHPRELEAVRERLQSWPSLASLPLGAMVETPAAAFALPEWRDKADFVAIGCNDLMQAFHAADRNRPELSTYLDPYAPSWLRFLSRLAEEGRALDLPMRVCGQLPGLPGLFVLLLGMEFRSFSVEPVQIPFLGHIARQTDADVAHDLLRKACQASNSEEVRDLLGLTAS
ncbi:MAG: putative PEP-binding protein [Pseudomonadota bacterium]